MEGVKVTVRALMQTFSCAGQTSEVREAEGFLNRSLEDKEFVFVLLEIIRDAENFSVRTAACLLLKEAVRKHWHIDMDCEMKQRFMGAYFVVLQQCEGLASLLLHTTRVFVELLKYSKELDLFMSMAENEFDGHVLASLIVVEALVHTVKVQIGSDVRVYGQSQIPHVVHVLEISSNLRLLTLCFRILYCLVKYGFIELPSEVVGLCFRFMELLSNLCEAVDFSFTKAALKLYAHILRRQACNVDPNNALALLKKFVEMIGQDLPVFLRPYQCNVFHAFMEFQPTRCAIASAIPMFCENVILPFFRLSPDDIEDSIHNVKSFLASFHAQVLDYCDYRGCICACLSGNPLGEEIGNFFASMLDTGLSEDLTYSVLHILSSCPHNTFERCAALLHSSSHLVRTGALLCLRQLPCSLYPVEFYIPIVQLLNDEALLVRYFSMTSLDIMWQKEDRQAETVRVCLPFIPLILERYTQLAAEFSDFDFVRFIANFLSFFSGSLIDNASDIIVKVFTIYLHFLGCSEDPTSTGIIITELFLFIRACLTAQANITLSLNALILTILEHYNTIPNAVRGTLLTLASNIVCMLPDALPAYDLIVREVPSMLQTSETDEVSEALLNLLRNLVLRFHANLDCDTLLQFALTTTQALVQSWDRLSSIYSSFLLISALIDAHEPPDSLFALLQSLIAPFLELQDSWESLSALLLSMFTRGFRPTPELYSVFIEISSSAQLRAFANIFQDPTLQPTIESKERAEADFSDTDDYAVIPKLALTTCSFRQTPQTPLDTSAAPPRP